MFVITYIVQHHHAAHLGAFLHRNRCYILALHLIQNKRYLTIVWHYILAYWTLSKHQTSPLVTCCWTQQPDLPHQKERATDSQKVNNYTFVAHCSKWRLRSFKPTAWGTRGVLGPAKELQRTLAIIRSIEYVQKSKLPNRQWFLYKTRLN